MLGDCIQDSGMFQGVKVSNFFFDFLDKDSVVIVFVGEVLFIGVLGKILDLVGVVCQQMGIFLGFGILQFDGEVVSGIGKLVFSRVLVY